MRKTESLLIAEQNKIIRTNYVEGKKKTDEKQQNSECRLCGNRDKTIVYIKGEYSKLAKRVYKSKHDWVEKVIDWELCKNWPSG